MKKPQTLWACSVFILGLVFILHAQETETTDIQVEPLPFTGWDVASFSVFSEEQTAALVSLLDETPVIPFSSLSPDQFFGNFYSLQNPDWPPLPGNISGSSVWKISGPENAFLLNDVDHDYLAPIQK